MDNMANKFKLPQSLLDAVKNVQREESVYQDKVKALLKKKGFSSIGQMSPEEKKDFFNTLDTMHKAKHEEVELEEGKSSTGYELYHKDFSSAMGHAYDFAKKKYNIEIDPLEIDRNVAMGPRKPSSGKANAYRLLDKTGKKAIQVQVANLDNKRYELNMYKEDVELNEGYEKVVLDFLKKRGVDAEFKYGKLMIDKRDMAIAKKALAKPVGFSAKDLEIVAEESAYGRINDRFKKLSGRSMGDAAKEYGKDVKDLQQKIDAQKAENERRKAAMKTEEVELDEAIPKSTHYATLHSSSRKIVAKGNKKDMLKKMKELNKKEEGSHHLGVTHKGKVGDIFGEEVDLDEVSKKTLGSYINKASVDMANRTADGERKRTLAGADYAQNIKRGMSAKTANMDMKKDQDAAKPDVKKAINRMYGISKAVGRLTKEEVELDEMNKKAGDEIANYAQKLPANHMDKKDLMKVASMVRQGKTKEVMKFVTSLDSDPRDYVLSVMREEIAQMDEVEKKKNSLPFTPNKVKKPVKNSDGTIQSPMSRARELAQQGMKKVMKKEEVELDEKFSSAQIDKLRQEYDKIKGIDPASDNYKKLTAMLDKLDIKALQSLAGAKIKFVSGLAQNRIVRKMNEAKAVDTKKDATGNEKPVKSGDKISGKKETIVIDPEFSEKNK